MDGLMKVGERKRKRLTKMLLLNISLKYFSSIESNGTQGQLKYLELTKCKKVKINVTSLLFLRPFPKAALLPRGPAFRQASSSAMEECSNHHK
jgi:hypothetical protein